jgi:hypothetical protein
MHADTSASTSNNSAILTRSTADIDAELFKLYALANHVPPTTAYGEPLIEAIHAQISVLKRRLTTSEAGERYEDDHEYVIHEALNAAEWLHDHGDSPSAEWASIGIALD